MIKGTIWALAALMVISAGAYGNEQAVTKRKDKVPGKDSRKNRVPAPQSILTGEGKVLSAKFNEATGKIEVTILTDSWCNEMSAKLVSTISGRATFGPFHYRLELGPTTTRGCIPNIEKEKVLSIDAPNLAAMKDYAQIVIHGEDKTYATLSIGKDNLISDDREDGYKAPLLGNDTGHSVSFEQLQEFAAGSSDSGSATQNNEQSDVPAFGNFGGSAVSEEGYQASGAK